MGNTADRRRIYEVGLRERQLVAQRLVTAGRGALAVAALAWVYLAFQLGNSSPGASARAIVEEAAWLVGVLAVTTLLSVVGTALFVCGRMALRAADQAYELLNLLRAAAPGDDSR